MDPRTDIKPKRSSIAMMAWVLPPTEGVVRSWKSKKRHWPTLMGDRLIVWRSVLCSLPIVQTVHEPKKLVIRSISWFVRWVWCERWPWLRVDLRA